MTQPTALRTPQQHLAPGTMLGPLRISALLGSGGSAFTYRGVDTTNNRDIAIKEYFPKRWSTRHRDGMVSASTDAFRPLFQAGLDRFIAEAEILARFRSPGIVRVERVFASMGTGYMQLTFLDGRTLAEWLETRRAVPTQADIDRFAASLIASVEIIHGAGVLHCDIAPKNIMLSADGMPILIDFGSARLALSHQLREPAALVTPHYSPQELYNTSGQQRGPWTDIYAAAAVLRAMIGAPPPPAPERALGEPLPSCQQLPAASVYRPGFLAAIDWGLAFRPAHRPKSMMEWRAALLGTTPVGVSPLAQ